MSEQIKTPVGTGASNVVYLSGLDTNNNKLESPKRQVLHEEDKQSLFQEVYKTLRALSNRRIAEYIFRLVKQDLWGAS